MPLFADRVSNYLILSELGKIYVYFVARVECVRASVIRTIDSNLLSDRYYISRSHQGDSFRLLASVDI